jgi:hypothetical protein
VAIDLPAIVIETEAPRTMRTLASLGDANEGLRAFVAHEDARAIDAAIAPPPVTFAFDAVEHATRVASIEASLHAARASLDLADPKSVESLRAKIAETYAKVRAHPEDAEAPWLLAETLRTLARIELLAGDAEAASELRARARVIDGGRLLGLSEGTEGAAAAADARVTIALTLVGAPKGSIAHVDGASAPADATVTLKIAPGEHNLRVVLGGEDGMDGGTIDARWLAVGDAAQQTIAFRVAPPPPACTRDDLAPAIDALAAGSGAFAVECGRWIVVRKTGARAVEVRVCDAYACGAPSTWMAPPIETPKGHPADGGETSVWSSPWTYVALGAGAAAIGGIVAWRLGAFDRPSAPPPTWQWQGVSAKP